VAARLTQHDERLVVHAGDRGVWTDVRQFVDCAALAAAVPNGW
jgi:hypothetical protein